MKCRHDGMFHFRWFWKCSCRIIQINNFLHDDFASYP
jgi:hypothetical protein